MQREQTVTLGSPTFIGLLLAQFTATFNDQATHMVAVFFASDMLIRYAGSRVFDEKAIPAVVALCFMLPFFIFSPLAGRLADRFSKRSTIVMWKVAEVAFMLVALAALSVPALTGAPGPSAAAAAAAGLLMVGTVFLMGLHSTFFVPAKYGIMPEILHPSVLSRGNGFLEGTSFMAQIFGTSAGGLVYYLCKSRISGQGGRQVLDPGREWIVGLFLVGLAAIGTVTAFLMKRVPAAAPDRPVRWTWLGPLKENLTLLVRARPLFVALIGVSFVAFMTVFLRQTLLYDAELRAKPEVVQRIVSGQHEPAEDAPTREMTWMSRVGDAIRDPELKVSLMIAVVGFGVGVGSLTAGYCSGDRVELGLVPVGALAMVAVAGPMAMFLDSTPVLVAILFLLGLSAGFVVVPLYTQMQHRAPKERKGNIIATANFVYVCGGIGAVVLFYVATFTFERLFGPSLTLDEVRQSPQLLNEYLRQLEAQMRVPKALIGLTALFTVLMTAALWIRQPDFPLRTALWMRRIFGRRVRVRGADHLPLAEPLFLDLTCRSFLETLHVMAAVDRSTRFVIVEPKTAQGEGGLRWMARACGWQLLQEDASEAEWSHATAVGLRAIRHGHAAGIAILLPDTSKVAADRAARVKDEWQASANSQRVFVNTIEPEESSPGGTSRLQR